MCHIKNVNDKKKGLQWNFENIVVIIIKHLQIN